MRNLATKIIFLMKLINLCLSFFSLKELRSHLSSIILLAVFTIVQIINVLLRKLSKLIFIWCVIRSFLVLKWLRFSLLCGEIVHWVIFLNFVWIFIINHFLIARFGNVISLLCLSTFRTTVYDFVSFNFFRLLLCLKLLLLLHVIETIIIAAIELNCWWFVIVFEERGSIYTCSLFIISSFNKMVLILVLFFKYLDDWVWFVNKHILLLTRLIKVLRLHYNCLILSVHNRLLIWLLSHLTLLTLMALMTLIAWLVLNTQMTCIKHLILRCIYLLLTKEISISLRIRISF